MSDRQVPEKSLSILARVISECQKTIVGKKESLQAILMGLLSDGHILLEGVPGVAKTTIAKTFSGVTGLEFRRVQGSADALPSDLVGTYIFDQEKKVFKLQKGPVFTNILLIDEINRNSPKTNSAVLEAMQERQVTISGDTHKLPSPFMVVATQSPVEYHGVFPLPEVLIDRFLLSVNVDYPSAEEEVQIANRISLASVDNVESAITREQLGYLTDLAKTVYLAPNVQSYIVDIVQRTRQLTGIALGASPRASIAISKASRSLALMNGRMYVTPDDVKQLAPLALRHRLIPSTSIGNPSTDEVIRGILQEVPIPPRAD